MLIKQMLESLRNTGDKITGGGVRALFKRTLERLYRFYKRRPLLMSLTRLLLRPFPRLSSFLYQTATSSYPSRALAASTFADLELSASARSIYQRLERESKLWN